MKALGLVVSDKKIFKNCILKTYFLTPWPTYATNQNHLNNFGRGLPRDHSCWVWSNCMLKTYFLTTWPTYATNQNHLKNFGRGPPRDHSCEDWSKSNEWFQRRRCLSKKVYGRCTTHDDGQRPVTIAHPEHFVHRWAKNMRFFRI